MTYTQEINQNKNKILISKTLAITAMTLLVVDTIGTFIAQGSYRLLPLNYKQRVNYCLILGEIYQ
jgi:hypothetical protein